MINNRDKYYGKNYALADGNVAYAALENFLSIAGLKIEREEILEDGEVYYIK